MAPNKDYSKQRIDMGARNDTYFLRDDWLIGSGRRGISAAYSQGPAASIAYKFKTAKDHSLKVALYPTVPDQKVSLDVNGTMIAVLEFLSPISKTSGPAVHEVTIPAASITASSTNSRPSPSNWPSITRKYPPSAPRTTPTALQLTGLKSNKARDRDMIKSAQVQHSKRELAPSTHRT